MLKPSKSVWRDSERLFSTFKDMGVGKYFSYKFVEVGAFLTSIYNTMLSVDTSLAIEFNQKTLVELNKIMDPIATKMCTDWNKSEFKSMCENTKDPDIQQILGDGKTISNVYSKFVELHALHIAELNKSKLELVDDLVGQAAKIMTNSDIYMTLSELARTLTQLDSVLRTAANLIIAFLERHLPEDVTMREETIAVVGIMPTEPGWEKRFHDMMRNLNYKY